MLERLPVENPADAPAVEGVRIEQALGAEADAHRGIIRNASGAHRFGPKTAPKPRPDAASDLLVLRAVDRLRASGGQPRLLRPRQEPIEPS